MRRETTYSVIAYTLLSTAGVASFVLPPSLTQGDCMVTPVAAVPHGHTATSMPADLKRLKEIEAAARDAVKAYEGR